MRRLSYGQKGTCHRMRQRDSRRVSIKPRGLHIESLENRQLLSAAATQLDEPPATAFAAEDSVAAQAVASGWQSLVLNGREIGTLDLQFRRNVSTVDPQGQPVAVNEPRFADPRAVSSTPQWTLVEPDDDNISFLGAGWDHDGVTPLALMENKTDGRLTVFRGAGLEVANTIDVRQTEYEDLLAGTVPGFRYIARAAIVHEGLIVILTQRDRAQDEAWIADGITFVWTQDHGATFHRVEQVGGGFDVPPLAGDVAEGIDRGQTWGFSNAFPEKSPNDVLGAWFPWSDYLYRAGQPKGGQIGLFRARRAAVGEPWVVEPNKLVYERWEPTDGGGLHAHSAGMFTDGMASFWGDTGKRNNMVRHVAEDLENYTGDVWTHVEQFQGAWSPEDAPVWVLGNQAASTAPGAALGDIITTGDQQPEVIMKVQAPDAVVDKAIITKLRGTTIALASGGAYQRRVSLWIHHLRGRGYVVAEKNPPGLHGIAAMHFSADGEHWVALPTVGGGNPLLYGDQFIIASAGGILVADQPSDPQPFAPLLVNPGGTNLLNATLHEAEPPEDGWNYRQVEVVDGTFRYVDDGSLISPQPVDLPPVSPEMPIWEITTTGASDKGGIRDLADIASELSSHHWLVMWQYSLDGNGIEPGYEFGAQGERISRRATRWFANQEWLPSFHRGIPSPDAPLSAENRLWVYDGSSSDRAAPRRWLVVGEGLVEGPAPIYPLSPGETGPDEIAIARGFSTGAEWTIGMTFSLPAISAFSSLEDSMGDTFERPIATLIESASNRVEIYYTRANNTLWIDGYLSDFLTQKLIFPNVQLDHQDKVNLIVSTSEDTFSATLQVMRNDYPVTHQEQTSNGSIRPSRIYFSDATRSLVTPLEWYAVQVNENVALSAEERAEMLVSDQMFRVLDAGGRLGDMDLDGDVDFDDIDPLIAGLRNPQAYTDVFTVAPHVNGDGDGDGDFDFDDIALIVDVFTNLPPDLRGDMDLDEDVDFDDIDDFVLALLDPDAYEQLYGALPVLNGDIDEDDDVDFDDIDDFVLVLTNNASAAARQAATSMAARPAAPGPRLTAPDVDAAFTISPVLWGDLPEDELPDERGASATAPNSPPALSALPRIRVATTRLPQRSDCLAKRPSVAAGRRAAADVPARLADEVASERIDDGLFDSPRSRLP